jgi:2-iminobutanoate/2-iminopropanoate deaminase
MYFVSGQVGIDPQTGTCEASVTGQTAQVLANMQALLADAGLSLADVVKTTIYVTNMNDFAAVNEVYAQHFGEPYPARATVGVADLPHVGKGTPILVEIDAIAMKQPN